MSGRAVFELDFLEIVEAALDILKEDGLDAVSMRTVAARLGVSPVPVYNRVGNKESLLSAMAEHVLADFAPRPRRDEEWQSYAMRWATALRARLRETRDFRRLLGHPRSPYIEATKPLINIIRNSGFPTDSAVQICRLVTWATCGSVLIEPGMAELPRTTRHRRPGSDPSGVTKAEAEALFQMHLRYVIEGFERDTDLQSDTFA
ncbi:MAG: TetR family transcriptional regulator [Acidimicrobiales bacterium]